jgi:hypothetical protein
MKVNFNCLDCKVHTAKAGEYYMLTDRTWARVHDSYDGMLCIGCVEERLGRELRACDFLTCPLNDLANERWYRSPRLTSRLTKEKTMNHLDIKLSPTQGEAIRMLADEDPRIERVIASRPSTQSYLLMRIHNKTEARAVTKHMRTMIENLTDAERTGPSVKMSYALGRHVDTIKSHFEV